MQEQDNLALLIGLHMALKIKPGVEFVVAPAGIAIIQALKNTSKILGLDLTITSGSDGIHSGPNDPHHKGEAYDIRSHDLQPNDRRRVLSIVMNQLGNEFFGFLEDEHTSNEHFHIQLAKSIEFDMEHYVEN